MVMHMNIATFMKRFRLTIALTALLVLCAAGRPAVAADPATAPDDALYLTASLGSHHFGKRDDGSRFNEFNPGLGLEWTQSPFAAAGPLDFRLSLIGGFYYNSIERMSVYAGGGPEACHGLRDAVSVCAGISVGGVTGYRVSVAPAAIGSLKLEHNPSGAFVKLGVIPQYSDVTPTVLTLQLGYRLPY